MSTDIADVINDAVAASLPAQEEATPVVDTPADTPTPDAYLDAPDAVADEAEAPSDAASEDADAAVTDEEPSVPDGYVAVPAIADELATEFVLRDADGEVEVPDLVVEYKANGKVRKDRLDQVVKLAQWGVYNQERDAQTKQVEQEREQLAELVKTRELQLERLLTDDEFLMAVRDAYAEENSPERRAERSEARIQEMQVQQQMEHIHNTGMAFLNSDIEPAIDLLVSALPSVTPQELSDRITMALQAHAERAPDGSAYVPPSRYDAIRQYIVDDLAIWAQAQHQRRTASATPPAATRAQRELERAQIEAQKAKRMVGHTLKPVGRAARDTGAKPSSTKPATLDDAVASAMDNVLAGLR